MQLLVPKVSLLRALFVLFFLSSIVAYTYTVQSNQDWVLALLLVRWGLLFSFCLLCLLFSKNVIFYLVLIGGAVVLSLVGEREHISYLALIIFSYAVSEQKNNDVASLFLKAAHINLLGICLVFTLSFLGVLESTVFINTLGFAFEKRDGLGFYNPNPASLLLLSCVVVFSAFGKSGMFFLSLMLFWFFQIWLGSRTYIVVSVLVCLVFFIRGRIVLLRFFCFSLVCVLAALPMLVVWVSNSAGFNLLGVDVNALLSDRLNVMRLVFENSGGLSSFPSDEFIAIDPGFINLLGYIGVLLYYFFLIGFLVALFKEKRGGVLIAMIAFVFSNFTENAISPYNLMSLLFFVFLFINIKDSSREKNENHCL